MMKEEEVEGWNNVFTDCPIKQSDLTQPTEGFLVRALVCYVRRFGYNVEPPFSLTATDTVENSRDNRLFLIRLVWQIDHFLKITDKSYSFNYFDLIRPTPKKTAHTLYILLNYLFYYNMYKEEVFKKASGPIKEFQEITADIERMRRDNELKLQETHNLQADIEKLDQDLSMLETDNKEQSKQIESQEEEKKKLNEQRESLELSLKRLQEQKQTLSREIVSDEEVLELQKQIDYVKEEFEKLKLNEGSSVDKLRELEDSVDLLQHSIKEIEKASEIIPTRLLAQMLESSKQVEEAEKTMRDAEHRKAELLENIEKETSDQADLAEEYERKKEEFQNKTNVQNKLVIDLEIRSKESDALAIQLQEDAQKFEYKLLDERDIKSYIDENITEILGAYENLNIEKETSNQDGLAEEYERKKEEFHHKSNFKNKLVTSRSKESDALAIKLEEDALKMKGI